MRTVLITGCTSGFGKLLVGLFLNHGDQVIATGRRLSARQDILAEERQKFGSRLVELDLDVTNETQRQAVLSRVSRLDILINNAGYGLAGALEDLNETQIRAQMEVNFFGTVLMTQACLPLLRSSRGKIFNFSSVFGFMGFPLMSLYCASKFAVEGFTEGLSHELAPHGVQVCMIEPGAYRTNFATGILWGEASQNSQSPYYVQTKNYQRLQEKLMGRPNPPDPREVAEKIFKLANATKVPLRVRSGKDANATHWMRRLLPAQSFHQITGRFYRKVFMKGLSL